MSERLTDAELDEIGLRFPTHFGEPPMSVLVQRLLSEHRDLRADIATAQHALANERQVSEGLRLSGEEREALAVGRQLVAEVLDQRDLWIPAKSDEQRAQNAAWHRVRTSLAVLDKLLKEQP